MLWNFYKDLLIDGMSSSHKTVPYFALEYGIKKFQKNKEEL